MYASDRQKAKGNLSLTLTIQVHCPGKQSAGHQKTKQKLLIRPTEQEKMWGKNWLKVNAADRTKKIMLEKMKIDRT